MTNLLDKIKILAALCKCEVNITINEHTTSYQNVEQYLNDREDDDTVKEIPPDTLAKMIEKNTMVWVSAYPNTPVGFFSAYDHDIETALDSVIKDIVEYNEPKEQSQ